MKKESKLNAIFKWAISNLIWEYIKPVLSILISSIGVFIQKLGIPMFSDNQAFNFAIYFFIIYGVLALVADLIKIYSRTKSKIDNDNRAEESIKTITKNGSQSLVVGGNVGGNLTQNFGTTEKKEPINIIVGFTSKDQTLVNTLRLSLEPLPKLPSIENIIKQKSDKLMAKYHQMEHNSMLGISIHPLYKQTSNYLDKVSRYLKELEDYYLNIYKFLIMDDRYRIVYPAVENISENSASKVIMQRFFCKFESEIPSFL